MRFASLGSGSKGNALLVQVGGSSVMLDCGFGLHDCCQRLARLGMVAEQLDGILVTHEHGDHIGGVARLARKFGLPVWLTHGTLRAQPKLFADISGLREIDPHQRFAIGDIEIHPYPVPHDATEPVQFVFSDGAKRLGVLTDAGCSTPHILSMLEGCHALVLECNHDSEMLRNGEYHYRLKQRVGGRLGHLSNLQAADILANLDTRQLQHIVAAHISEQNNLPELAVSALCQVLDCEKEWVGVACQQHGFDWREIV
ncbi:MAG: MBL fold metallo-hydrolase [Gallionella sp.]|nr:MBL fold metallo-hydrolase [Gallionella sp.]MDD4946420.1 MBL fold metallo-hydrolase [Gallionella sp.]MDD5611683.1 MBL fold metallo-hydrolase [Gallionella sp.]